MKTLRPTQNRFEHSLSLIALLFPSTFDLVLGTRTDFYMDLSMITTQCTATAILCFILFCYRGCTADFTGSNILGITGK